MDYEELLSLYRSNKLAAIVALEKLPKSQLTLLRTELGLPRGIPVLRGIRMRLAESASLLELRTEKGERT